MTMTTWPRLLICLIPLALAPTGCGSGTPPATADDEAALREHMQAVDDEERAHFQETAQAVATTPPEFPNEAAARPGGD
jgi:hypothetical protein